MQLLRLSSTGSKFPKFLMSSKHKSVPPQSLHHSSALWHITPLYFFWPKHNILSTKIAHQSAKFQTFECSNHPTFTQFLMPFLKLQDQVLLRFCIIIQCHERQFLSSSIEKKFSDFWVVGWKFTKILMSYLKPQVSFSLNFVSLFSVLF